MAKRPVLARATIIHDEQVPGVGLQVQYQSFNRAHVMRLSAIIYDDTLSQGRAAFFPVRRPRPRPLVAQGEKMRGKTDYSWMRRC